MDNTDLQIQLAEAKAAVYVPGQWRCGKCGFVLTKSILFAKDGAVGPDLGQAEPCPNDGDPMERALWKDEAFRLADLFTAGMRRESALRAELETLEAQIHVPREDLAALVRVAQEQTRYIEQTDKSATGSIYGIEYADKTIAKVAVRLNP